MNLMIYSNLFSIFLVFSIIFYVGGVEKRQISIGQYFFPKTAQFPDIGWNSEAHISAEPIYDEIIPVPDEDLPLTGETQRETNRPTIEFISKNHLNSPVTRVASMMRNAQNLYTVNSLLTTTMSALLTRKPPTHSVNLTKKIPLINKVPPKIESDIEARKVKVSKQISYGNFMMNKDRTQRDSNEEEVFMLIKIYNLLKSLHEELRTLKKESAKISGYLTEIKNKVPNTLAIQCKNTTEGINRKVVHHITATTTQNARSQKKPLEPTTKPVSIKITTQKMRRKLQNIKKPVIHRVHTTHLVRKINSTQYNVNKENIKNNQPENRNFQVEHGHNSRDKNQKIGINGIHKLVTNPPKQPRHTALVKNNHNRNLIVFTKQNSKYNKVTTIQPLPRGVKIRPLLHKTNKHLQTSAGNESLNLTNYSKWNYFLTRQRTTRSSVKVSQLFNKPQITTYAKEDYRKKVLTTKTPTTINQSKNDHDQNQPYSTEFQQRLNSILSKFGDKTIITGNRFLTNKTPAMFKQNKLSYYTKSPMSSKSTQQFSRIFPPKPLIKKSTINPTQFSDLWPDVLLEGIEIDYV